MRTIADVHNEIEELMLDRGIATDFQKIDMIDMLRFEAFFIEMFHNGVEYNAKYAKAFSKSNGIDMYSIPNIRKRTIAVLLLGVHFNNAGSFVLFVNTETGERLEIHKTNSGLSNRTEAFNTFVSCFQGKIEVETNEYTPDLVVDIEDEEPTPIDTFAKACYGILRDWNTINVKVFSFIKTTGGAK